MISEKRHTAEGDTVKHRVMIFQEDVGKFQKALADAFRLMGGESSPPVSAHKELTHG